jgi:predicted anti-sigma-YlaC factor YlaD
VRWPRQRRGVSCRDVAVVLQLYLDGHTDPVTTARVTQHLDGCRRCGMDRDVYVALKRALARRAELDGETVSRLRAFGESLTAGGAIGEAGRS